MPRQQKRLQFPFKGLFEGISFSDQPPATTPACKNVIGFDPRTGRNRGASRSGSSKFCPVQINGDNAIQSIQSVQISLPWSPLLNEDGSPILLEDGSILVQEGSALIDAGERQATSVAVAGGTVKVFDRIGTTAVIDGDLALSQSRQVIMSVPFRGNIFYADGDNYKYYDSGLNQMIEWTANLSEKIVSATNATPVVVTLASALSIPTGSTVTLANTLVAGLDGDWVVTNISSTSFSLDGSTAPGAAATGGDCTYIGGGDMPTDEDGEKCTILTLWAGRIVMAGLPGLSAKTLFASAAEDPFNWEYDPPVQNVRQAFAGNRADNTLGQNPDIITNLIAHTDDLLVIGGDSTIHLLRGNPIEGGRIDLISKITGIAKGYCWCQTPEGIIYFLGSRGGIYQLSVGGGEPLRMTAFTLDDTMSRIDHSKNAITFIWDDQHVGIRIFITPYSTSGMQLSESMQFFYDVRNEAWWPMEFGNPDHNPRAIHLYDGPDPFDRVVLFGGNDGYIRQIDRESETDDGYSINSFVMIGPITNQIIAELQTIMAKTSGEVRWSLHEADDHESALNSPAQASGTFSAGKNPSEWPMQHMEQGYIKISSDNAWALEQITMIIDQDTETRVRIY